MRRFTAPALASLLLVTPAVAQQAPPVIQTVLKLAETATVTARPDELTATLRADIVAGNAATGGVVGIWPPKSIFRTLPDYVRGILRMVEAIGVDHVGIGSDMAGFGPSPSNLAVYSDAGPLMVALRGAGLSDVDLAKVMGGNFARVFQAVAAAKG